ncbi:MAG: glycosyltransferase [Acidobacteriota bacterium]
MIEALDRSFDITAPTLREAFGDRLDHASARRFGVPSWASPPRHVRPLQERAQALEDRHSPDVVVVAHASTLARLEGVAWRAPLVVDAYDLLWTQVRRRAGRRWPGRLRAMLREGLARRYELRLLSRARLVWVCSTLDARRLASAGFSGQAVVTGRPSVVVVPNVAPPPAATTAVPSTRARPPTALFVGTMGYHANRSGIRWFAEEIWPRVRERLPTARCRIVGRWPAWSPPPATLDQPGLEVAGFVDELAPEWRGADVFVCPLRVGSGTRIKILEAWSQRLAVVSTSVGAEGLIEPSDGGADGPPALLADDPEAFAEATVRVLAEADLAKAVAAAGHRLWRDRYTPEVAASAAAASIDRLLGC